MCRCLGRAVSQPFLAQNGGPTLSKSAVFSQKRSMDDWSNGWSCLKMTGSWRWGHPRVILGFIVNVDQSGRSLSTPKRLVLALQISLDWNFLFFSETVPHGHLFLMAPYHSISNPARFDMYIYTNLSPIVQGCILTLSRFLFSDQKQIEKIYRYQI